MKNIMKMKNLKLALFAVSLLALTLQSCKDEDPVIGKKKLVVENKQRATVAYVGATWCPPCGTYGDPTKSYMTSAHGDDVVILNSQAGDAISASGSFGHLFGNEFQKSVGSTSIPHAYWLGANVDMVHRGFYTDQNANNEHASREIEAIIKNDPNVGVAAKATLSDDVVTVETLSKFYKSSDVSHYIGVYLLEDKVEAKQSGAPSDAPGGITSHENVLRAAAYTDNNLGIQSVGESFTENQEVQGNYSIEIPRTVLNNDNLKVAVVIFESNKPDGVSNSILVDIN